jgi:DCN1-like protein 3
MGLCLEKVRSERRPMSHNNHLSVSTKHVKKKAKQDATEQQSNHIRHSYRQMNTTTTALEPRRDLPLHKIPELLAKITGTLSSTLSSSLDTKQTFSSSFSSSSNPNSNSNSIDRRLQLFKHYSNDDEIMSVDGILRFCSDLSIEPDCYEVLLFCFVCRAKQMYSLTKDEFICGLKTLGNHVDNLVDLRTTLFNYDVLPYENEFYIWTYHYGLIDGQRCVTTQNAISLWRLFYSKNIEKPQIFDRWLNYLEQDVNNEIPKTITCDTWTIFPQFAKFIQLNGYEAYDDNEAWPCLFDGFVEYELEQQKKIKDNIIIN